MSYEYRNYSVLHSLSVHTSGGMVVPTKPTNLPGGILLQIYGPINGIYENDISENISLLY